MNELIFQLHSPEEFRYFSSLGHWVAGYIFLGVAIVALLQALGFLKSQKYMWPVLVTIAGLVFIPYNMMHHGLNELPLVWKVILLDPQQRQHFIMFNLLFVAGIVELLLSLGKIKGKFWNFAWPGVILVIGYMFLTHPQHGTAEAIAYSKPFHTILGSVLLLTGILKAAEVFWGAKYKLVTFGWIIFLFITSVILITYNEPEGSYQIDNSTNLEWSKELNEALKNEGKTVEYFEYEGQDHNFKNLGWDVISKRTVDFFDKYLKK